MCARERGGGGGGGEEMEESGVKGRRRETSERKRLARKARSAFSARATEEILQGMAARGNQVSEQIENQISLRVTTKRRGELRARPLPVAS